MEGGNGFDRQPPQDLTAEQSVLGGMMLSKDAIADVVEVLRPGDFYRPAHQLVYDCVLDLYSRGEPADAVTVAAELERRGELRRVGGAPYLHTLIATVPTAANASYYAEIVAEKATLRRLVEAGTRIVQLGYSGAEGADINEVVDRAQSSIYEVTERRMTEDYVALEELLQPTMDEIDAIASRGGTSLGVPTGFADLEAVTNGLHPGQMIIVAARPGIGKALALDTPLPTPTGWTTMGAVEVGDHLLGADGRPTRVVAATDVLRDRPCHAVEFADGTVIVADAEHQWLTEAPGERPAVHTTGQLAARDVVHSVVNTRPLDLPARELAVPPYKLGVWLAGQHDERIPTEYLRASAAQRLELLAGLLDTDGTVPPTGELRLPPALVEDAYELLVSLGYRATVTGTGTLAFTTASREVVDVRPVPSVPVRCVEVDTADHLYLAGRAMVPTHNSTLGLDFARSCSIAHRMTSVIFSLEMSRTEIVMRMLSAEAKIRLQDMRGGRMTDDDWTRLARRMSEVSEAPLFVDDSPNMTMMEIRAKARRLKQRHDLKLVVVDYMQLMTSGKRVESRQQEVSEFSRQLKLLAKELEVPVVAISQLNRGPEQRTDKRPMLSDLRESGCLTRGTRVLRADTGTEVTFGELLESGELPAVWSLDERLRMVARPVAKVFPSGVKEVFSLRLASGRELEATANHPFLTVDGWVPLGELAVGDRLAVPRQVPQPTEAKSMPEAELVLLAHLIGDGSLVARQPISYAGTDEESERGPRGSEKPIPDRVFQLPNEQVAQFVRHLWATGGSVRWDDMARQARIHYASTSRPLLDGLAQLLLRVGVLSRIRWAPEAGHPDCWHLHICGAENQLQFLKDVGVHGERGRAARTVAEKLSDVLGNTNVDTVPRQVWTQVRSALAAKQITHRDFAAAMGSRFCGSTMWKHSPSRSRVARVATILKDSDLEMLATNDVFWDEVVEITSLGEQPVYDATVPGTHNFVANGIHVHNSLEQDADMVILINRPDAFERDDPRAGEADLILAKHRAGPTATITVAHQLHYSRFTDLAQS
ncbi:replicative DNA helicase [Actinophytocola sp.]|uniref:replicative DNA helicase n=1 Tax=Actinophytocola sp. TaxID=1872138 RepID=UPI00389B1EA6